MKFRRTITVILAAVMLISLAACNTAGSQYSEKNAYVSIYVYGSNNKTLLSSEAIRVAPIDESELVEDTTEGGLWTEDYARQLYRVTPTPIYALELAIRAKDKNAALPEIVVSQFNGEVEYTLDTVMNSTAGKATGSNDIYEWQCKINGEVVDAFKTKLETYDSVVFALVEKTYRSFTVAFEINDGEKTLVPETKFSALGEKSELTISNFLQSVYQNDKGEDVEKVMKTLGITLSEDGKRVVKIGSLENDEEHRWVCYYYDEEEEDEIISDLTDEMISERKTISFDYRDIESEDTGEETAAEPAE